MDKQNAKNEKGMVDLLNQEMKELQDSQKQIEEIKKYIGYFFVTEAALRDHLSEVEKEIEKRKEVYAKRFYNAGYRKLDDHAIMVLRNAKGLEDKIRKETAEKFAERLKEKLEENSPIAGYDLEDLEFDGETIQECIDEIAKELTEGK